MSKQIFSEIVSCDIGIDNAPFCSIHIPKDEVFRVKSIFESKSYAIPLGPDPQMQLNVVDIGANVGVFSLYIKSQFPNATIHAYEPLPALYELLTKNTQGFSDIHCYPFGLSDKDQQCNIYFTPNNSGETSIKRRTDFYETISIKEAKSSFEESGINHIDVLKIDTEGCECEIIESLLYIIDDIKIILVEYHSESDRRRIDQLLINFTLFSSRVMMPGLGENKYIHKKFYPDDNHLHHE